MGRVAVSEADERVQAPRVLFVGEVNPYGGRPELALYHLPRNASGNRLRVLLGLSDRDYLKCCARADLCTGKWSLPAARCAAADFIDKRGEVVFVLLGARVRQAFGGPPNFGASSVIGGRGRVLLLGLPHPSGLCRVWKDPASVPKALELLRRVVPEVPWGSHEDARAKT